MIPVIRYRTRDITRIMPEPCVCGRSHARIARITGRCDDMLIIRGVNVYPSQIETALVGFADLAPHYQLVLTRDGAMDALLVEVGKKHCRKAPVCTGCPLEHLEHIVE